MSSTTISIRREELYEKVWMTPMQKLAKEFGLSDVGLAKLCRRHRVPVPGRGYWARIRAGQKLWRNPLPPVVGARLDLIQIHRPERRPVICDLPTGQQEIPTITVTEDCPIMHSHALRIERFMSRTRKDGDGLPLPRKGRAVPLRVSAGLLPRALRILNAVFFALEEANHAIKWQKPYDTPLKVIVVEEEVGFSVSELVERKAHQPTKEELARKKVKRWWEPPKWDYIPTGRLKIEIHTGEYLNVRRMWSDGKKKRLEDCLGEFLIGLITTAKALKALRQERAERARQWEEQRKREEEEGDEEKLMSERPVP